MAELFVYERGKPETAVCLWPHLSETSSIIQEAREYIFELRNVSNPDSIDLTLDDLPAEALRSPDSSTARWKWQPGFYAGSIQASIQWPERKETFEIVTDTDLKKLTRSNFDTMVREILEDTFALFNLSSFRTGIATGTGGDVPPLARLEFIRSRVEQLEKVVRQIDEKPVRVLRATNDTILIQKAKNLTSPELLRSARGGRQLKRPEEGYTHLPLFLPEKVLKTRKSDGLNIREHQDIKSCLQSWAAWLDVISAKLARRVSEDRELQKVQRLWVSRCRLLSFKLRNLLKLPLFAEVTDRKAPVALTSIYRRISTYRHFFELYRDMNLGIAQITGDHLQMPLARTFDLYELWCFLRILRAATSMFGVEQIEGTGLFDRTANGGLILQATGTCIPLGRGYFLSFQHSFREYWSESSNVGSFSRSMRPDLSLTMPSPTPEIPLPGQDNIGYLIVLDAKYRVNQQLDDAITSLHTYRDAIVKADNQDATQRLVIAAYVLTPHLPTTNGEWKSSKMPNRLFHPDYRTTFKFGAITLMPGQSMTEVENALATLLKDSVLLP